MPNNTTNYSLYKPLVNDATDEDLWGGYNNDSMDLIDTQMKVNADAIVTATSVAVIGDLVYPVGTIYINKTVSTNPGTLFGFGTWVAITDRMIIGASGTYAAGTTGGSATTTITTSNMPSHTHLYSTGVGGTGGSQHASATASDTAAKNVTTTATGSGTAATTISPYVAAYIWERTA